MKIKSVHRTRYTCTKKKPTRYCKKKDEEQDIKNIKQNEKGMRRIRRENAK